MPNQNNEQSLEDVLKEAMQSDYEEQSKERDLFVKGINEYINKNYAAALECFNSISKNSKIALRYAADTLAELGEWDKAAQVYESLLESSPKDKHALNALGRIYLSKGEKSKAINFFRKAAEKGSRFAAYNLHHFEKYSKSRLSADENKLLDDSRKLFEKQESIELIRNLEKIELIWQREQRIRELESEIEHLKEHYQKTI